MANAKAIMIQGTGSNVGKSMLVAGVLRALSNRGFTVLPFKPQNMSNNAAVTSDGGEIGRAQALQALAARALPHTDMNPVLLKPQSTTGAQVIVHGRVRGNAEATDYVRDKESLLPAVLESFQRLSKRCEFIVVEGAGSPAETNLRSGDIANMGFATAAQVPVVLAGDIDRGGVIAQMIGTKEVISIEDKNYIKGFIINKFRGDVSLFDKGRDFISDHTGWPCLGVLPWFDEANRLPAEDIMDLGRSKRPDAAKLHIAVPRLPRISNFDDLDPLMSEPDVDVNILEPGTPLPADTDVVLLIGSKSTIADLRALRQEGWDVDIAAHVRRGGHVLGICGGYQMLGRTIADPQGVEGPSGATEGLGLLHVDTMLTPTKELALCDGHLINTGAKLTGYEIHMGETDGPDTNRPWLVINGKPQGAVSPDGRVKGCYVHGLFTSDAFRKAWLADYKTPSSLSYDKMVDETLNNLASHIETHLDVDHLIALARMPAL